MRLESSVEVINGRPSSPLIRVLTTARKANGKGDEEDPVPERAHDNSVARPTDNSPQQAAQSAVKQGARPPVSPPDQLW